MSVSRISRGTPVVSFPKELQEAYVKAADANPQKVQEIEAVTGRSWSSLTFGEKLLAIQQKLIVGQVDAALVAASRASRDLSDEASVIRDGVTLTDLATLQDRTIRELREQNNRLLQQNEQTRPRHSSPSHAALRRASSRPIRTRPAAPTRPSAPGLASPRRRASPPHAAPTGRARPIQSTPVRHAAPNNTESLADTPSIC